MKILRAGEKDGTKFFSCNGKRITEKIYLHKLRLQQVGSKLGNGSTITSNLKKGIDLDMPVRNMRTPVEGRRIIHYEHMAKQMYCKKCDYPLEMINIDEEKQRMCASILIIYCGKCNFANSVTTDKQHVVRNSKRKSKHFDINTKIALGNYY